MQNGAEREWKDWRGFTGHGRGRGRVWSGRAFSELLLLLWLPCDASSCQRGLELIWDGNLGSQEVF